MANTHALEKILDLQELEKQKALKVYQNSIDQFEEVATKLYYLLRKKEEAELNYETSIKKAIPIDEIKTQTSYINKLQEQILNLQGDVQQARSYMEKSRDELTDSYKEVKKFETVIERRKKEEFELSKKLEAKLMDEISLQQFVGHMNR
ncbi:flagellar export protein FliJ [Ornithinibacillus halophilus]|uniref:Flagellar FliJ protein n=1 Tax=Ornithinibacillus halophilus TaxID=930117 RepID=A0A1M5CAH1_9BACI|nr:flagellar export protein FliJ [Ornithinibacillus halophilus]SHF51587.1 flagellar FliJ protein [Ornithinibacillus halophilus]